MINVIVIKNNIIHTNYIYNTFIEAEEWFRFLCKKYISNWSTLTEEDISNILDDGYIEFDNGSICINHPIKNTINKETNYEIRKS